MSDKKIKHIKVLQKKMTYNEAMSYIALHKKWRLPTSSEAVELDTDVKLYRVAGDDLIVENGYTLCRTNKDLVNVLLKLRVVLVPAIEDIITGNTFIANIPLTGYEAAMINTLFNSTILTKSNVEKVIKNISIKKIQDISKIMTDNDVMILNIKL